MNKVIKLQPEQIKKLMDIREKYYTLMAKLGDIDIQIYNLNKIKDELFNEYTDVQQEEKKIIDEIGKQYGYGKINLNTGELNIENNSTI